MTQYLPCVVEVLSGSGMYRSGELPTRDQGLFPRDPRVARRAGFAVYSVPLGCPGRRWSHVSSYPGSKLRLTETSRCYSDDVRDHILIRDLEVVAVQSQEHDRS